MTYHLYCVVNAFGVPYQDTLDSEKEQSWFKHWWRDVPKDGNTYNSCKERTSLAHQDKLKANGDRVVSATVTTHETVTTEIHL